MFPYNPNTTPPIGRSIRDNLSMGLGNQPQMWGDSSDANRAAIQQQQEQRKQQRVQHQQQLAQRQMMQPQQAQGGMAQGGMAQGGMAQGGMAQGGMAQGGLGGMAQSPSMSPSGFPQTIGTPPMKRPPLSDMGALPANMLDPSWNNPVQQAPSIRQPQASAWTAAPKPAAQATTFNPALAGTTVNALRGAI